MQRLTKGQHELLPQAHPHGGVPGRDDAGARVAYCAATTVAGQAVHRSRPTSTTRCAPRFEKLAGKQYVFTLSDAVPGGVYAHPHARRRRRSADAPLLVEEMLVDGAPRRTHLEKNDIPMNHCCARPSSPCAPARGSPAARGPTTSPPSTACSTCRSACATTRARTSRWSTSAPARSTALAGRGEVRRLRDHDHRRQRDLDRRRTRQRPARQRDDQAAARSAGATLQAKVQKACFIGPQLRFRP